MTAQMREGPGKFGVFLAPFHSTRLDPTTALHSDLELMTWLDKLGFDEAWIGEHHSGGWEIIGAPELFIAVAAERTRHLRFGTGVCSLPFHQPLMLADRMVLLDHLTRGRTMLGVGPGVLPSDAHMMGVPVSEQRAMMVEALEAILALLHDREPVTRKTTWFELRNARLQLRPYTKPHFEVAVSSAVSPSGPTTAGRFGCGLLSFGATQGAGFNMLQSNWAVAEERARDFGTTVDRRSWRIVGPMHLADTREQAARDVAFGLADWVDYFSKVAVLPLSPAGESLADLIRTVIDSGFGVIGTPDDAVQQIKRLTEQSGGFGTYLLMAHDWANPEATRRSYELFARHVAPQFTSALSSREASQAWVAENRGEFLGLADSATQSAFRQHEEERARQ